VTAPGLLIAAVRSGSGKTTLALGLMRALARRGMRVGAAKCGPDYIDPAFHKAATGRESLNLDSWTMGEGLIERLAARAASDAKVAEVDRRLANLATEIEALRSGAQQEAEADAQRVRREAAAEMAKIQSHIAEEIAAASKSATLELRRYSADLALELAERKIAARLTPETQDRLVRTFVATMSHAAGAQNN